MIHTNQAMAEGFTSVYNMSIKMATVLSLPATYAIIYGFTFAYSRQLRSMGMSAIVNPWFGKTWKYNGAPYAALLGGSVMVFVLCFAAHFQKRLSDELFNLSILFACSTYIAQLVGYVYFVKKLSSIKRNYRSPLGVYGAYYSIFVFFCLFVSIIGFQGTQVAIIVYVGFSLIMAGYYFYAVKDRQYFSKEEQQVLFIAHVCQSK